MSYLILREKSSPVFALANFGFIPKGALKDGAPIKFHFMGFKTVGCPQRPEA